MCAVDGCITQETIFFRGDFPGLKKKVWWENISLALLIHFPYKFIVSIACFNSSSTQHDVHFVNDGKIWNKIDNKQDMLQGLATLRLTSRYHSTSWGSQSDPVSVVTPYTLLHNHGHFWLQNAIMLNTVPQKSCSQSNGRHHDGFKLCRSASSSHYPKMWMSFLKDIYVLFLIQSWLNKSKKVCNDYLINWLVDRKTTDHRVFQKSKTCFSHFSNKNWKHLLVPASIFKDASFSLSFIIRKWMNC